MFKKGQSGNPNGRPKGAKNKATAKREKQIAASGITPLDYMLQVLRDKKSTTDDKRWAAAASAPYVHPRLAAVHNTEGASKSHEQWLRELRDDNEADDDPDT